MPKNPEDPINFDQSLDGVLKVGSQKSGGEKIKSSTQSDVPVIQVSQNQKQKKFFKKRKIPHKHMKGSKSGKKGKSSAQGGVAGGNVPGAGIMNVSGGIVLGEGVQSEMKNLLIAKEKVEEARAKAVEAAVKNKEAEVKNELAMEKLEQDIMKEIRDFKMADLGSMVKVEKAPASTATTPA
jgi:uncharacterized membrane protein